MTFFALFYGLVIAHFIADYMQPAALVAWTKRNGNGLYVHVGLYTFLTGLVLVGYNRFWLLSVFTLTALHFLCDKLKYYVSEKAGKHYVQWFLIDQAVHGTAILLVSWLMFAVGGGASRATMFIQSHFYVFVMLTATMGAAFGGSILVFEAVRTFAPSDDRRIISLIDRLPGILERIAVCLILFATTFPYLAWLPFGYSGGRLIRDWTTSHRLRRTVELIASIVSLGMSAALYYAQYIK